MTNLVPRLFMVDKMTCNYYLFFLVSTVKYIDAKNKNENYLFCIWSDFLIYVM